MDKLAKTRAEVERLYKLVSDPVLGGEDLMLGERNAYFRILKYIDSMQEEYASGDLEKAVELYADNMEVSAGCGTEFTTEELKDAIMFGANYQKQQLMKDAVDTKIISDGCFPIIKYQLPLTYDCKIGDKVKLIIVKEE